MSQPTDPFRLPHHDLHPAAATPAPRRRRGRRLVAAVAVSTVVVGGALGVGVATSSGSISATGWTNGDQTQTWTWGTSPSTGTDGSGANGLGNGTFPNDQGNSDQGGSGRYSGSQTATVDSDPATAAEEKGVALIDTQTTSGAAAGTGIVLTSDGEVLTNYHVVEGSTTVQVTIASTGRTYTATVVGADQKSDVALLKLADASGLTTATIDDDTVQLGDDVTAVGNAGGTGELSAADGTITDLSTSITTASEDGVAGEKLTQLIETSSDVVAGDSGGPLIDSEGEVIGIDTAASTGQVINGYAIPIQSALTIVAEIQSGTETASVRIGPAAFLGVEIAGDDNTRSGATVSGVVTGGAAEAAGLQAGDTVTKIGGTTITSQSGLSAAIAKHQPGDKVKITWTTSSGSTKSATVTLKSSPVN